MEFPDLEVASSVHLVRFGDLSTHVYQDQEGDRKRQLAFCCSVLRFSCILLVCFHDPSFLKSWWNRSCTGDGCLNTRHDAWAGDVLHERSAQWNSGEVTYDGTCDACASIPSVVSL